MPCTCTCPCQMPMPNAHAKCPCQMPQDKAAEKEAEARGGAADVALTPSSYDFERRLPYP
eukprot:scaffold88386_cov57-Phaeocystis_antarctica.AAC.1